MAQAKFKILSIDGGGIRGIIPCTILKFIEEQTNQPISKSFDLISGTSTGGIIALGLAAPDNYWQNAYKVDDLLSLYKDNGWEIFYSRTSDTTSLLGSLVGGTANDLLQQPYDSAGIERLLEQKFGATKLSESLTNVLITTYELEKGKPFYFLSRLAKQNAEEDFLMKTIGRSTSAAPTFFVPSFAQYENQQQAFVDGGVFANNPSVLAYGEAKELLRNRPEVGSKGFGAVVSSSDDEDPIFMLSIGTGNAKQLIKGNDAAEWRTKDWIKPLMEVLMQSVAESTHYTMQHLLPNYSDGSQRYVRLNIEIPHEISQMDNAYDANINKLCEIADTYVKENQDKLLRICEVLTNPRKAIIV